MLRTSKYLFCLKPHKITFVLQKNYHKTKAEIYKECFALLGISEYSTQDEVRSAYINLVKKVHPDSGHKDASADNFAKIDSAFRMLQAKFAKERRGIYDEPAVKNYDIKHTAPQHRQYLSYEGTGYGPPSQREKQYQQIRASKAHERVVEYRIEVATASEGALIDKQTYYKNHAIKTKYGFDRIVEDLIQVAMSKGDFNNLSGLGKPLSDAQSQNPYVDFTQHKINKILLDNGFTPEWITLQKEIRMELDDLKDMLKKCRLSIGSLPLSPVDEEYWTKIVQEKKSIAKEINKKIDKYNLLVPIITQQMISVNFERISNDILQTCPCRESYANGNQSSKNNINNGHTATPGTSDNKGFFSLFSSFL